MDYKDGKVYVIHVPQSLYPPHQNSLDGIYYIRLESETTKAPHGLIQAMFNKRQFPNLEIELYIFLVNDNKKHIVYELRNESLITALKVGYIIEIFGVKTFYLVKNTRVKQKYKNVNLIIRENDVIKNDDENHFSFHDSFETLNKGLFLTRDFIVEPFDTNIMIEIVTWAKDTELKHKLWVINPTKDDPILKSDEKIDNYKEFFSEYKIKSTIYFKDNQDEQ